MGRTTFGINRSPSQLCLMVQGCGHWCDFYCDEARRCGTEGRRLFRVSPKNIQSLMLAGSGCRLVPRRVSSVKSTVCGLNGFLPSARADGSLHLKSSTPECLRGSCAYAFLSPWSNGNSRFRFGNKNCALLIFLSKTESTGFRGEKGRTQDEWPNPAGRVAGRGMTAIQITN